VALRPLLPSLHSARHVPEPPGPRRYAWIVSSARRRVDKLATPPVAEKALLRAPHAREVEGPWCQPERQAQAG
jgi:hypothetical protein